LKGPNNQKGMFNCLRGSTIGYLLLFILVICLLTSAKPSKKGYVIDYSLIGKMMGVTKGEGNMKIYCKKNMKRVTMNMVFREAGSTFPTIDERDLIVNYKDGIRLFNSSDLDEWIESEFIEVPIIIEKTNIKVTKKGSRKVINIEIVPKSDPMIGGTLKYLIRIIYTKGTPRSELEAFKDYKKPSAIEFLSVFFENENLSKVLNKLVGATSWRIPDKFSITVIRDGMEHISVQGKLQAKMKMKLFKTAFSHE